MKTMKNLRKTLKLACLSAGLFLGYANASAAGYSLTFKSGGTATYRPGSNWSDAGIFNCAGGDAYVYYLTFGGDLNSSNFSSSDFIIGGNNVSWTPGAYLGFINSTNNTIQLAGTTPGGLACGQSGTVEIQIYNAEGQKVIDYTYHVNTPSESISGPANICDGTSPTYSVVTNEMLGLTGTNYKWSSSNSNWTISPAGIGAYQPATLTPPTAATTESTTITLTGGDLCQPLSYVVTASPTTPLTAPSAFGYSLTKVPYTNLYNGVVTPVAGATSYEWEITGGSYAARSFVAGTTVDEEFEPNTTYNVYITATNACKTSPTAEFTKTTGGTPVCNGCKQNPFKTNELEGNSIKMYPNPANTELNIEYTVPDGVSDVNMDVYDMLGKKVTTWVLSANSGNATENVSGLTKGLYIYVISNGNNVMERGKLMIQH